MAILNRIINILILLAAIAAVVFSYLLFSKREKLVDGWSQMATAINTTANTLDKDSGTNYASTDLATDKMSHTNYENLNQVLPKINTAATGVRDQRNDLADALLRAGTALDITSIKGEELKNVKNYKSQVSNFQTGVTKFRKDRDNLSQGIVEILQQIKVSISQRDLNNSKTFPATIANAKDKAKAFAERQSVYASYLTQFNRAMGFSSINLNTESYRPILAAALKKFQAAKREADTTKTQLKKAESRIKNLQQQLADQKLANQKNQEVIRKKDSVIEHQKNILTKNGSLPLPPKLLTPADKRECYAYVRGTIDYIDADYGFITINIGSSYVFIQQYGTRQNPVHFPLEPGKIMTVVRNLGTPNETPIGKVFVSKVEENISVCNLLGGQPELYKIGDTVIFTPDDIEKALDSQKK